MNKKLIAIISAAALVIVVIMVASFVACNGNNNPGEEDSSSDNQVVIPSESGDENESESTEGNGSSTAANPGELTYTDADGYVFVINPFANEIPVRAGDNEWLGAVKVGEKLERLGVSSDMRWTKVKYNNGVAYIATRNLTTYDKGNNNFVAIEKEIKLTGAVTVRVSPQVPAGAKGDEEEALNAVAWLKAGDTIKVIAVDEALGWYKIEFVPTGYGVPTAPTVEGYTYEYFVKIMDKKEEEESSEETTGDVIEEATEESSSETEAENNEGAASGK